MRKLLIIYPHWHPANLAGVHRPRLIGNFLKEFGWKPRVLTVKEEYFEEKPDLDFAKTFSSAFEVTRVKAYKVSRPRIVGDIGLRAFSQLYKAALEIIKNESIDFIWLPIPSFYNALLGPLLYDKTKIPYGIDYIDPWVRDLTNQKGLRAKISQSLARFLEPIAVKKAALISGVSTPYYESVIRRNFPEFYDDKEQLRPQTINRQTEQNMVHVGMPYGFDPKDHDVVLPHITYPWGNKSAGKHWVYAGAFLPNSHLLLTAFFEAIHNLRKKKKWDEKINLWFLGTGDYPAKSISSYAEDYDLDTIVHERRQRYPFLQVLNFLSVADTVMIIGSTEKHYTASKTFQALLSERPVLSVFHYESSAVEVMERCEADAFTVRYHSEFSKNELVNSFEEKIMARLHSSSWNPDLRALEKYSAKESARKLTEAIDKIVA